ncbi:hypothetical protein J1605_009904 [Eschrichtius robustus]|uniref:Uncharacterized protein n=1 Tax=Eschrichtius robustus TaxID=9764 RepID=A0AB34GVQ8_ESCRO|nr:hypothetical protein J1605_009904 [Eschrichtius robustus]
MLRVSLACPQEQEEEESKSSQHLSQVISSRPVIGIPATYVPQLLKPSRLDPVLRNKRSHRNEKPVHRNEKPVHRNEE